MSAFMEDPNSCSRMDTYGLFYGVGLTINRTGLHRSTPDRTGPYWTTPDPTAPVPDPTEPGRIEL